MFHFDPEALPRLIAKAFVHVAMALPGLGVAQLIQFLCDVRGVLALLGARAN